MTSDTFTEFIPVYGEHMLKSCPKDLGFFFHAMFFNSVPHTCTKGLSQIKSCCTFGENGFSLL